MSLLIPLIAAATAQQVIPPPMPLPSRPGRVIAWDTLPPVPYRAAPAVQPEMSVFVASEVAAGRCRHNGATAARGTITVDVAMLVTPDMGPRLTVPRAIDCPTVEQYAAGLVLSFTRNNLPERATLVPQWYRATLHFQWPN
ncbi:hypothetical protein [Sphingomonas sp.]|uniref:hypothetical protein n=1 Tax=Sphingomonas sp. TaxID=28214 RepID=UPI002B7F15A6|nr:hypothetical protein [Sphingomonas sp.]HTG37335.1 hypothetical protein [Sphingomonas sp.]